MQIACGVRVSLRGILDALSISDYQHSSHLYSEPLRCIMGGRAAVSSCTVCASLTFVVRSRGGSSVIMRTKVPEQSRRVNTRTARQLGPTSACQTIHGWGIAEFERILASSAHFRPLPTCPYISRRPVSSSSGLYFIMAQCCIATPWACLCLGSLSWQGLSRCSANRRLGGYILV